MLNLHLLTVDLLAILFKSESAALLNLRHPSLLPAEVALAAEVPEVAALVAATEEAPAAVPVVEVAPAEATAVMDCQTARR